MTIFQAIVLGLVEGITEFLPVSSTAHLLVVEKLMGNVVPSIFFNTVVQLGALGAVIVYFHARIITLARDSMEYLNKAMAGEIKPSPSSLPTGINILVASLPIFLVGFVLRNQIESLHNSILVISLSSIFVAIFLWYGQRISKRDPKSRVGARELITMGIYQIMALVPGVSRSGIVMVGGLMQGLSFEKVLEYSFLMSIPALGAAGLFELAGLVNSPPDTQVLVSTLIATVVSFGSALVVIKALLTLVKRIGFTPFVVYRLFFGIVAFLLR